MTTGSTESQEPDRRHLLFVLLLVGALISIALLAGWGVRAAIAPSVAGPTARPTPGVVTGSSAPVLGRVQAAQGGRVSASRTGTARVTAAGRGLLVQGAPLGALAPGVSVRVPVVVTNAGAGPVTLTDVTGEVDAVRAGCPPEWFRFSAFRGARRLAGSAATTVDLVLTLVDLAGTNQDACKGARYTFTLRAEGLA